MSLTAPAVECARLLGFDSKDASTNQRSNIRDGVRAVRGPDEVRVLADALEEVGESSYLTFLSLLSRARRSQDSEERRKLDLEARSIFFKERGRWVSDWEAHRDFRLHLALDENGLPTGLQLSLDVGENANNLGHLLERVVGAMTEWGLRSLSLRIVRSGSENPEPPSDISIASLRWVLNQILAIPVPLESLQLSFPRRVLYGHSVTASIRQFLERLRQTSSLSSLSMLSLEAAGSAASAMVLEGVGKFSNLRSLEIKDAEAEVNSAPAKYLAGLRKLHQIGLHLEFAWTQLAVASNAESIAENCLKEWHRWIGERPLLRALDYSAPFAHLPYLPFNYGLRELTLRRSVYLVGVVEDLLRDLHNLTRLTMSGARLSRTNALENESSAPLQLFIEAVSRVPLLETLVMDDFVLEHTEDLDFSSWKGLQSLTRIDSSDYSLRPTELAQWEQIPHLRRLRISPSLTEPQVIGLLASFPALEDLTLGFPGGYREHIGIYEQLKQLPHLKAFRVRRHLEPEDFVARLQPLLPHLHLELLEPYELP